MPTFLVTSRMSPELRARVQAAVRADLRQRTLFPNRARKWRWFRLLALFAIGALGAFLVITYRQSRREVEDRRSSILAEYQKARATVPLGARQRLQGLVPLFRDPKLAPVTQPPPLDLLLAHPFLYVRVEARQLERSNEALEAVGESTVDALATCLVTPPANLRESTLLRAIGQPAPRGRVFAAGEALAALDFFDSSFEREVRTAQHMQELERYSARLQRDTLASGLLALEAQVLLVATDEAKTSGVVSDFDGEAPHEIVLRAFELASARLLWQTTARVDPGWISDKSRLAYSRALDSCRLAFELRSPSTGAAGAPR